MAPAAPAVEGSKEEEMRIASFLPSATEMIFSLGLGDMVVGVSHECDYPPEAQKKPRLVDCALDLEGMTMAQIDVAVSEQLAAGKSVYHVSEQALKAAAPTLLVTQSLCEVCGPAGNEVTQVLKMLKPGPEILWQTPKSFEEVLQCYVELGQKTGREERALAWVESARSRVAAVAEKVTSRGSGQKTRVCFLEWVDPLYCGGHWVPQMLDWAGGEDVNCNDGSDSTRMAWEKVLAWQPEVVVVAPCGFKTDKALEQARQLVESKPDFMTLPAAQQGKVYAVDANSYFARPGPRLVEGVELLAHLINGPELCPWDGPEDAYAAVLPLPSKEGEKEEKEAVPQP